jgi:hypothetical protein
MVSLSGTPCFLAALGDNRLQRLSAMSRRLERHLRLLDAYNREYRREDL